MKRHLKLKWVIVLVFVMYLWAHVSFHFVNLRVLVSTWTNVLCVKLEPRKKRQLELMVVLKFGQFIYLSHTFHLLALVLRQLSSPGWRCLWVKMEPHTKAQLDLKLVLKFGFLICSPIFLSLHSFLGHLFSLHGAFHRWS